MKTNLFILAAAMTLIFALTGCSSYQVVLLGDLHYDTLDSHGDISKRHEETQYAIKRNVEAWKTTVPDLLERSGKHKTPEFSIQLGDLVEGGFETADDHKRVTAEAVEKVTASQNRPVYFVKGNHDVSATSWRMNDQIRQAYLDVMQPHMNQLCQVENKTNQVNYSKMINGDLYIFFDNSMDFAKKALTSHPEARYVFFVTHLPVLPCANGWSASWVVNGSTKNQSANRAELFSLLAKRNAVILAAHTHNSTIIQCETEEGTVTQLSVFSQPKVQDDNFSIKKYTGKEYFTPELCSITDK